MPAVVRVKRRVDEEPLGAFILNGKKRRLNTETLGEDFTLGAEFDLTDKDEISTVVKFGGTVEEGNSSASNIVRINKTVARDLVGQKSRKPTNHTERAREEMRQSLHENRFRVVNCMRTLVDDDASGTELTIVDIEKQKTAAPHTSASNMDEATTSAAAASTAILSNAAQQPADSDTGYVYDLYFPENAQQAENVDLLAEHNLSVRIYDNFFYEDCADDDNYNDDDDDSEDSNNENYFSNDYPDEDEFVMADYCDETEEAQQMRDAFASFVFDEHEDESSSDDDFPSVESDLDQEYRLSPTHIRNLEFNMELENSSTVNPRPPGPAPTSDEDSSD